MKRALVIGCSGQASSYLIELLLSKNYLVFATYRRVSTPNLWRIQHLLQSANLRLLPADLLDYESIENAVTEAQPDEVYNCAAQSDVAMSFKMAEFTRATIKQGTQNILDACEEQEKQPRILLFGSSEMFGNSPPPQNEKTLFRPVSPYAMAKVDAFRMGQAWRRDGVWIAQGIFFNYESPRRGENFVTRKITRALGNMAFLAQNTCSLGNLDAKRDWGHCRDSMEAAWLMLQHNDPDDYVIATGETRTVAEFLEESCEVVSRIEAERKGENWRALFTQNKLRFTIDKSLFRPAEVHCLQGDASKAREKLGWKPRTTFSELVSEMVRADYELARGEALLKSENLRSETQ